MRFEVGESAAVLRDAAAQVLAAQASPAVVRSAWPGGASAPSGNGSLSSGVGAVWRQLAEVGVVGTLVAERSDGLGLDENSVTPVLETIGYYGLPVPALETIAVGAPLLAAAGDPRLDAVLSGATMVTAQLTGNEVLPFAGVAELVIVRRGERLCLYELPQLTLTAQSTVDGSRGSARIDAFDGDGVVLTDDPQLIELTWRRGVLGCSALLVGLTARMLEMTVAYVKNREQYGVPVGSFQAVKHTLASALLAVEFARPMVSAAAWYLADQPAGPETGCYVGAAKVVASDAARLVARTAIQCHGAMGYTTEYDLHLFAKRAWALAPSWGDPNFHRSHLADALGVRTEWTT